MAQLTFARFLDPLTLVLVALAVGLYLAFRDGGRDGAAGRRSARAGRALAWATWGGLWVISTPFTANYLTVWTETTGPDLGAALAGKDLDKAAMVVLAAGIRTDDPSLAPRERLDSASTQRVVTAARLWAEHPLGLVVISGTPAAETEGMADLAARLGVPAGSIVRESRSLNTRQNAAFSAAVLRERGVETVVLVTSASHLRRAARDFAATGLHVIPAAAEYGGPSNVEIDSFLPSAPSLAQSQLCLHELLGYLRG
jgi:uncharacterized SAM-binding protein YcdF (DUF218 family)